MSKSAATRLDEIWAYINPSTGQKSNIQGQMLRNNQIEDTIAGALSLGWWVRGGSTEKTRRGAVRASAFLDIVNLRTPANRMASVLTTNEERTQKELDDNIATILRLFTPTATNTTGGGKALVTKTTGVAMSSMNQGNTQKIRLARDALNQASAMLTQVWPKLIRAQTQGTEARAYYERWFGTYSATRYATVKGVLKTMHDILCSSEVCLHLRTTDMIGKADDTPGAGQGAVIPATIMTPNGGYALSTLFAWAIPKGADGKPHVFLCDVFYATNGKGPHDSMKTGEDWSDNIGGVMLHEMSHALCGTKDNIYPGTGNACYGRQLCSDLALNYPDLAVDNADNFEIYCEDARTI